MREIVQSAIGIGAIATLGLVEYSNANSQTAIEIQATVKISGFGLIPFKTAFTQAIASERFYVTNNNARKLVKNIWELDPGCDLVRSSREPIPPIKDEYVGKTLPIRSASEWQSLRSGIFPLSFSATYAAKVGGFAAEVEQCFLALRHDDVVSTMSKVRLYPEGLGPSAQVQLTDAVKDAYKALGGKVFSAINDRYAAGQGKINLTDQKPSGPQLFQGKYDLRQTNVWTDSEGNVIQLFVRCAAGCWSSILYIPSEAIFKNKSPPERKL